MKLINLAQIQGGKALEADVNSLKERKLVEVKKNDNSIKVVSSTNADGDKTVFEVGVAISEIENNALALDNDGLKVIIPAGTSYSVVKKQTPNTGFLASYQLVADGTTPMGVDINIPKDYLVKSAQVATIVEENVPVNGAVGDKYLDFVVNTAANDGTDSHIYLNVKDLTDVYTGSSTLTGALAPTQVSVNVNSSNLISATLVDGGVTLDKLAQEVKDAIAEAKAAGDNASSALDDFEEENSGDLTSLSERLTLVQQTVGIADNDLVPSTTLKTRLNNVETKANENEVAIATLNGNASQAGSVAKTVKDAVDAAESRVAQTTNALSDRITANTQAIADAIVTANAYTDLLAVNLSDQYDKFSITGTSSITAFTLNKVPNSEKVVVYINHVPYLEDEGMYIVNRVAKTVTWTADADHGGFDINENLTDEVIIKYKIYPIPNAVPTTPTEDPNSSDEPG